MLHYISKFQPLYLLEIRKILKNVKLHLIKKLRFFHKSIKQFIHLQVMLYLSDNSELLQYR